MGFEFCSIVHIPPAIRETTNFWEEETAELGAEQGSKECYINVHQYYNFFKRLLWNFLIIIIIIEGREETVGERKNPW